MQGSSFDAQEKFSTKGKSRPNKVKAVKGKGKDSRQRRQRREEKWVAA